MCQKEVVIFFYFKALPEHYNRGPEDNREEPQFLFQHLNLLIPRYKARLLTAFSVCLILNFETDVVLILHKVNQT